MKRFDERKTKKATELAKKNLRRAYRKERKCEAEQRAEEKEIRRD